MMDLVHSTCHGRLQARILRRPPVKPLPGTPESNAWPGLALQYGRAVARWLQRHACLLADLELTIWPEQEESIAAGLAAATPGLRAFICSSASTGRLLCALSGAQQLTVLALHLQLQEGTHSTAQQYQAALASLLHLQSLSLSGSWCDSHPLPVLGPALVRLSQLTELLLPRVLMDAGSVQLLPLSLVKLQVCCHNTPLQLQRLTALRSLHLEQELHADENLPQSLTALRLGRCQGVQPLLPLPQLKWLQVDFDLSAEQLQQISGMTQLDELQLTYFCERGHGQSCRQASAVAEAAAQFSRVPLKQLKLIGQIGRGFLPASVVEQLGSSTQLTALSIQDLQVGTDPQKLAAQLQRLPKLQQLHLRSVQWYEPQAGQSAEVTDAQRLEPLVRVLSSLSSLRELVWSGLPVQGPAAMHSTLQAATQLTALSLSGPSIDDIPLQKFLPSCC